MIIFTLVTNIPRAEISIEVLKIASRLLSELFDVSEQDILISVKTEVQMAWGTKPGFFALSTLQNTTSIHAEDTKKYAPSIFEYVERKLGIPRNRMYLGFMTLSPDNVAFDGKLYSTMKWE